MADSLFVRPATDEDARQLAKHLDASSSEAALYRGKIRPVPGTGSDLSFVSGFGSTVMGSLSAQVESGVATIQHVYVVSESREVGLGDALIQKLLSELRTREVHTIEAQALPGDRGMKNLFERHGLIAQTIHVGKSL
jgi:ribosomal protein S18 acetylase RimI-like enzyme